MNTPTLTLPLYKFGGDYYYSTNDRLCGCSDFVYHFLRKNDYTQLPKFIELNTSSAPKKTKGWRKIRIENAFHRYNVFISGKHVMTTSLYAMVIDFVRNRSIIEFWVKIEEV